MTWEELESYIRQQIQAQPRGFQAALAERLGISTPSVAQFVAGARGIPAGRVPTILDALGMELAVKPKSDPESKPCAGC